MHIRQFIEEFYPEYYSWNEYPASRTVSFCKVKDAHGILSNFAKTPIIVQLGSDPNCTILFSSAESMFQIMKFTDAGARREIYSKSGQGLKMCAKHYEKTVGVRPDWGMFIVDALKYVLMLKFEQNKQFRDELMATGDKFIVEDQTSFRKPADTYGAKLSADGSTWSGPNLMGRLLMELRNNGQLELKHQLPADILNFQDLL